ncbi:hypothetical protein TWF696_006810 [Orbilia brochopaga]|uniref:Uncharacterized protein n=1 Tax=Orbilia brochopaga TaxID=3140254 RepID=A0AAV9UPY4_9PEZI
MYAKGLMPVTFGISGLHGVHATPRPQTRSSMDALGGSQPQPEWVQPVNTIIVEQQDWDGFAGNPTPGTKVLENPLWYIFQCGYILRAMSGDSDILAYQLSRVLEDNQMNAFRQEYFRTIAPLMTRFLWTQMKRQSDGEWVWLWAQTKHDGDPLPTGIMDSGGILDTSFPRDDRAAQVDSLNPFPRDTLTMKVLLKKLFQNTPEYQPRGPVVYVSDTNFLQAWHTVKQVIENLGPLVERVIEYCNAFKWRQPAGEPQLAVSSLPRQTHVSNRQDIGYGNYLSSFGMTSYENASEDNAWIENGVLGYKLGLDVPNLYTVYASLVNSVYRGALPFIMDMFADLALRANDLGDQTIFGPEVDFALPNFNDFTVTREELEKRPQWSEDRYRTEPWPLAAPLAQTVVGTTN